MVFSSKIKNLFKIILMNCNFIFLNSFCKIGLNKSSNESFFLENILFENTFILPTISIFFNIFLIKGIYHPFLFNYHMSKPFKIICFSFLFSFYAIFSQKVKLEIKHFRFI